MNKKDISDIQKKVEDQVIFKIDTPLGLLEEILHCLNQIPNTKVKSFWFNNTYEICSEIKKHI